MSDAKKRFQKRKYHHRWRQHCAITANTTYIASTSHTLYTLYPYLPRLFEYIGERGGEGPPYDFFVFLTPPK